MANSCSTEAALLRGIQLEYVEPKDYNMKTVTAGEIPAQPLYSNDAEAWQKGYDQAVAEKDVIQAKLDAAIKVLKDISNTNHGEYGEVADIEIDCIVNEAFGKLKRPQ